MAEVDASSIPLAEVPPVEGLPADEAQRWALQATLMARLPQVGRRSWRRRVSEPIPALGLPWLLPLPV